MSIGPLFCVPYTNFFFLNEMHSTLHIYSNFFFFLDRNDRSIFNEKRNTKVGVCEELGQEIDQRRLVPSFNGWKGKIKEYKVTVSLMV